MATEDTNKTTEIKVDDKVRRIEGAGNIGLVIALREEVTSTSGEVGEKGLMINVLWDNGTQSYFSPEALELVT